MLFFAISLGIIALVYGYCGWRIIVPLGISFPLSIAPWLAIAVLAILPHTYILYLRQAELPDLVSGPLAWITYLSLGFAALLFSILVLRDLIWLAVDLVAWISPALGLPGDGLRELVLMDPERRHFLLNALNVGAVGVTGIATGVGVYEAKRRPRIVDVTVPIEHLPADLDGFRIIQLCDLHVGPTIGRAFVESVVEAANGLDADLIAFVGDLADGPVSRLRPDVEPLSELRSVHGTFFVTGNHEYYSGVEEWVPEIRRLGMDVLLNEHRLIRRGNGRLLIAGVTDHSAADMVPDHASDPDAAVRGAPEADARLLLAHQPISVLDVGDHFDLQLSGHTHGGQFVPWKYLIRLQQPYLAGLHDHDSTWIYVSRGTGYWGPPVRLRAASEITRITLRAAAAIA